MTSRSRRELGTLALWLGPAGAIIVSLLIAAIGAFSELGNPSACGGNCERQLAEAAEHRHHVIVACLFIGGIIAFAGWALRASVPDDD